MCASAQLIAHSVTGFLIHWNTLHWNSKIPTNQKENNQQILETEVERVRRRKKKPMNWSLNYKATNGMMNNRIKSILINEKWNKKCSPFNLQATKASQLVRCVISFASFNFIICSKIGYKGICFAFRLSIVSIFNM